MVFEFLLPLTCLHCRRPSRFSLCEVCVAPFHDVPRCVAHVSGIPLWVTAYYGGSVRRAIVAYKEEGVTSLRKPLSFAIANGIAHFAQEYPDLVVVPIPSRIQALRSRGEDAIGELAVAGTRAAGLPASAVQRMIRMSPLVRDQGGLGAAARRRNMTGALKLSPALVARSRARLVLIDDVVTTGETVRAAIALFPPEKVVGVVAIALVAPPTRASGGSPPGDGGSAHRLRWRPQ
ncbi:unannotated protein [freshwater metagenome]|uniref:Unannotated protein n=1 Tax=freshwater metagenome TaxID=449393 RepID=A0A6J6M2F1_9ZZZZ